MVFKGLVGALSDAGAQFTVNMANNGGDWKKAVSEIDGTSVLTSGVTSALTGPGMSTMTKVVNGMLIAFDAAIDVNIVKGDVSYIGKGKTLPEVVIDGMTGVIPGKVADEITSALSKNIKEDIQSGAFSTLTKGAKSEYREALETVSGEVFKKGTEWSVNFMGSLIGGQVNEEIKNTSSKNILYPLDPRNK